MEVPETNVRQEPKKLKPGRKPGSGKAKSTDPSESQGQEDGAGISANGPIDVIMAEDTPGPESHVQDVPAALPPTTPVVVAGDNPSQRPKGDAGPSETAIPPSTVPPEIEANTCLLYTSPSPRD